MSSLQDVLAGLQKSYLASLPEKISNLQALWSANELVKLETEYHKLKGTGRTYGLDEVTQIGALAERICQIDPSSLGKTLPLTVALLAKVKETREKGQVFTLEGDSDYSELAQLVRDAESKAG